MNNLPKIDLKTLATRIRPPRYAILVNLHSNDWRCDFNSVLKWNSLHWGGLNNIVIPTDRKTIDKPFWDLLDVFKPDYIFHYLKEQRHNADTVISENLINELSNRLNIFSQGKNKILYLMHTLNTHHLNLDILNILKDKENNNFKLYDFKINCNKNAELILRSKYGSLSNFSLLVDNYNRHLYNHYESNKPLEKLAFDIEYCNGNIRNQVVAFNKFYDTVYGNEQNTAFSITNFGLKKYKFNYKKDNDDTFYFIIGPTINDFYLYNSIDKMTNNAFWIGNIGNLKSESKLLIELLQKKDYEIISAGNSLKCHVISHSLNEKRLSKYWEKISDALSEISNIQYLVDCTIISSNIENIIHDINPYRFFEGYSSSDFYVDHFYNNFSMNPLKAPIPSSFKKLNSKDYNWYVDLDILSNSATSNNKDGYILPPIPSFNTDVFSELNNKQYKLVRFTGECISFYCPNLGFVDENLKDFIIKPKIQILEDEEIFKRIFESINIKYCISDKGNYEAQSIKLFNSFENIYNDFRNENIISVFEHYNFSNESRKTKSLNGQKGFMLNNVKRVYLNYNDINELIKDDDLTRTTIERYLSFNILKRGLILKCKYCKNCNWYDLKLLNQTFVCSRCQNEQLITKESWLKINEEEHLNEPTFYYSLNEIVYQGYSNDMRYPILTKGYLKNLAKYSFISIPEIEIKYIVKDSFEKQNEFDIICISDGEILIGEVKKKALKSDNINTYNEICNKLNARFVLSTYAEKWENETLSIINSLKWIKEPIILTRSELLE